MTYDEVLEKFQNPKRHGSGYNVTCPCHPDGKQSLTISESDDGKILINCKAGCSTESILQAVGLEFSDLFSESKRSSNGSQLGELVATYDYTDEQGNVVYRAERYQHPKDFRVCRPDGRGAWIKKHVFEGIQRYPYKLQNIQDAIENTKFVFICEGEKDCDNLLLIGVRSATTNVTGAGKWKGNGYEKHFKNAHVCIIPDNDNPGRAHAKQVAESLTGTAQEIRILEVPINKKGADVSDWIEQGLDREKLGELLTSAPTWREDFWPESLTCVEKPEFKKVAKKKKAFIPNPKPAEDSPEKLTDLNRTDDGNGKAIEMLYGDLMRYDHTAERWIVWNGKRWTTDDKCIAETFALASARKRGMACAQATDLHPATREAIFKWALRSESQASIQAALAAAKRQPKIATTAQDWDRDPWLLGVQNGVVDLKTGEFLAPDSSRLISKSVAAEYNSDSIAPVWEKAIWEIFSGDCDMIDFVQRALGYAITGSTREHCTFILWGKGRNGKSTILKMVKNMLGEYGTKSEFSTFLAQKNQAGGARDDLARLAGKRIVVAIESSENAKLDEGGIKELTGGDTMSARFLYGHTFEFDPEFKLFLATNHKPKIRGTDTGIWSRIRLIPFSENFEGREDKTLWDRLELEFSGMLNWLIDGCLEWQKKELSPPESVTKATSDYKNESDPLGKFISEECNIGDLFSQAAGTFYAAFKEFLKEDGEKEWTDKAIRKSLLDKDIAWKKTNHGMLYYGFELKVKSDG